MAEKLDEVVGIETDTDVESAINIDEIDSVVNECEGVELPLGFGRD